MIPFWFALFIAFVTYMVGAWEAQTLHQKNDSRDTDQGGNNRPGSVYDRTGKGRMNLTPDDLQDMEDAIFYACIFLAKKQEDPRITDDERRVIGGIITR